MAYHINASSDRYATTVMAKDGQYGSSSEKPENGEDVVDRRDGLDRRTINDSTADLDRRRGPGRRRSDFLRAAEEGELSKEQFMFLMAIHAFKEANERTFPTWTDVLEVVRKLGYRKTLPSDLKLGDQIEDWTEPADAESGV